MKKTAISCSSLRKHSRLLKRRISLAVSYQPFGIEEENYLGLRCNVGGGKRKLGAENEGRDVKSFEVSSFWNLVFLTKEQALE